MLRLRFGVRHEGAGATFRAALGGFLGAFAFRFDGVVVSNRELPFRPLDVTPWHILLRVREGALVYDGRELGVGATMLLSEHWLLPSRALGVAIRTAAPAVSLVAMRIPSATVRAPDAIVVLAENEPFSALEEVGRSLIEDTGTDDEVDLGLRRTWDALVASGVVVGSPPEGRDVAFDRAVERVSAVLSMALSQLEQNPQLVDLIDEAKVTERQLLHDMLDVQSRFGIVVRGWRDTLNYWRLVSATMFLGVPTLRVVDVARIVGFASTSTMARAFRNAGLSRPTDVRTRLLAGES